MTYGLVSAFGHASSLQTVFSRLKIGGGGYVSGIDIAPDGTKVCRTDTSGAYLHNGTNWVNIVTHQSMPAGDDLAVQGAGNGIYEIKIAPSDSNYLYMSIGGRCYASTNKGTSWTRTTITQEPFLDPNSKCRGMSSRMAVDPANKLVVIYTSPLNGPYITVDGGSNWTALSGIATSSTAGDGTGGYIVAFDPSSTVTGGKTQGIYLSSYGTGVYHSTNGGTTWTLTTSTPTTHFSMAVSPDGYVYLVTDPPGTTPGEGGSFTTIQIFHSGTWSSGTVGASHGNVLQGVGVDPNTTGRVLVIDGDGNISQSLDHGATWTGRSYHTVSSADVPWIVLAQGTTGGLFGATVVFDPITNKVWAGGGLGTYQSNPPVTQTLTSITNGTPAVFNKTAHGFSAGDPVGFNVSGGSMPTGLQNDVPYYVIATGLTANAFEVSGSFGGAAITTSGGSGTFSVTAGAKWASTTAGVENLDGIAFVKPPGGKAVMGVWDRTVFATADPTTYSATEYTGTFAAGWGLDFSASTPTTVVALVNWPFTSLSGYSLDGGTNWTAFATDPPNYGALAAQGGGAIAVSPGGGVGIGSTNIVVVGTDQGSNPNRPYYTTNGGTTWTASTFPVAVPTSGTTGWGAAYYLGHKTLCADRVTAGTFYAYNTFTNAVYKSTDSGANFTLAFDASSTWTVGAASSLLQIDAVPANAGHVFLSWGKQNDLAVTSNAPLHRSKDGGVTWVDLPGVTDVWAFGFGKAQSGGYPAMFIAGYLSGVWGLYRSDNADQVTPTWTAIGDGFPLGNFDRITTLAGDLDTFGKCYVAFAGSGFAYGQLQ